MINRTLEFSIVVKNCILSLHNYFPKTALSEKQAVEALNKNYLKYFVMFLCVIVENVVQNSDLISHSQLHTAKFLA